MKIKNFGMLRCLFVGIRGRVGVFVFFECLFLVRFRAVLISFLGFFRGLFT